MQTPEEDKVDLEFELIKKLNKDMKEAALLMKWDEARYLVDLYYQLQNYRLAAKNQIRSASLEPSSLLSHFAGNFVSLENNVKASLNTYISQFSVGQWAMSVCGIGPVIATGLLTLLDIRKAPMVQNFYSFAGVAPGITWEKGCVRPYCADLKTLFFKAGDCFVKFQNHDKDYYGQMYVARKQYEIPKNESDEYTEQALEGADRVKKTTEAYKWYAAMYSAEVSRGYWALKAETPKELTTKRNQFLKHYEGTVGSGVHMLSPGHLHSRARRYCVKMFISHLHHVMHVDYYERDPMHPFPMAKWPGVHTHFVPLPNWTGDLPEGKSLAQMYGEKGDKPIIHRVQP